MGERYWEKKRKEEKEKIYTGNQWGQSEIQADNSAEFVHPRLMYKYIRFNLLGC